MKAKRWAGERGREENLVCIIRFTSQKAFHSNLTVQFPIIFNSDIPVSLSLASPFAYNTLLFTHQPMLKHLLLITENCRNVEIEEN